MATFKCPVCGGSNFKTVDTKLMRQKCKGLYIAESGDFGGCSFEFPAVDQDKYSPEESGITEFCRGPLSTNAKGTPGEWRKPEPKPDQIISVPGHMIPKGAKLVECFLTEKEVIVCGGVEEDDESHDCDQMGCSTMSHVIHRFNLDDSYERKFGENNG